MESAAAVTHSGFARPSVFDQTYEVARRAVLSTLRQPAQWGPALIFPLFLLAVNAGGLDAATNIPGFPTDSYLTFALAVPFIQNGIFALLNAGTQLASEIESGFLDRLALTPISRAALITGELAGVVIQGIVFGALYLAVGLAVGADFASGVGGVFLLIALSTSITLALGCVGMFVAAKVGSSEAVQGMFPLFFMFLFLSSMAMPRPLIEQDWFRYIATGNPISYLIEGVRSLLISGIEAEELLIAFGICAAMITVFLTLAARALGGRLGR
ncbi:MAG: ABC transporter permease [Solirubrobacterales bacterium]